MIKITAWIFIWAFFSLLAIENIGDFPILDDRIAPRSGFLLHLKELAAGIL